MIRMVDKIVESLGHIFSSGYGWLLVVWNALVLLVQPEAWSFGVVGFAIVADLIWGILAAVKLKKFILSKALRETVKKVGIYAFALFGVLAVERILHTDGAFISVKLIALLAAVCELWSMSANMLIVKPDMPFLKFFRGQLKGEIKAKVSKDIDIDEILGESEVKSKKSGDKYGKEGEEVH